jgi:hypothetical protein
MEQNGTPHWLHRLLCACACGASKRECPPAIAQLMPAKAAREEYLINQTARLT